MNAPPDWLRVVAAAYDAGEDTWASDHVTVRRVRGGANNALYRVEADGQAYACKLCVVDERLRAVREYRALCLLDAAGLDIAPEPICLDDSCAILPFPTVVYRWLPGVTLSGPLTPHQLTALLGTYECLHSLHPGDVAGNDVPAAVFHWFQLSPYVADLRGFLAKYGRWLSISVRDGHDLHDRLSRLVDSCVEDVEAMAVDLSCDRSSLRLCRVDPNLANAVWSPDGRPRWVDWEYSGWGDPALDLADLRWHAALADLSETQHAWIRANYRRSAEDHGFPRRLGAWDRILVTRWPLLILRLLWSLHNGPDRERLTRPAADPVQVRSRLVRFTERAERFVHAQKRSAA